MRVFLMWLRCAVTFLFVFILDLHAAKPYILYCTVPHSDVNMIQRSTELSFFDFLWKTDSSSSLLSLVSMMTSMKGGILVLCSSVRI